MLQPTITKRDSLTGQCMYCALTVVARSAEYWFNKAVDVAQLQ